MAEERNARKRAGALRGGALRAPAIRDTRGCVNARVYVRSREETLMHLFDETIKLFFWIMITISDHNTDTAVPSAKDYAPSLSENTHSTFVKIPSIYSLFSHHAHITL